MTPMATKRWTQTLTACLMALALVMVTPAVAAQEEEGPPEEAIEFFPCGAGAARSAIEQVNDTAPLDIGRCEEHDGTWYFVPGEDTKSVFELVPDPGGPTPQDLPRHLNCGKYGGWEAWLNQLLVDANCNGWGNSEELGEGCDPLDPANSPDQPEQCYLPPDDSDEWEEWFVGHLPSALNCGGYDSVESTLNQMLVDASCSGSSNLEEVEGYCNPLNPFSNPEIPGTCLQEPDPDDPEEWANQTVQWTQGQVMWLQFVILSALPTWVSGTILWAVGQVPDPGE